MKKDRIPDALKSEARRKGRIPDLPATQAAPAGDRTTSVQPPCSPPSVERKAPSRSVTESIRTVERLLGERREGSETVHSLSDALSAIGETRCEEAALFLNSLLDDYLAHMPGEAFDVDEEEWKYRNLDFFHLLDCLVRQQDERAIPVLEKARDRFPPEYVDHIVCRIAIGRIRKKRVEGYLPMEALEIQLPTDLLMSAFRGEDQPERDFLQEKYGEYLND